MWQRFKERFVAFKQTKLSSVLFVLCAVLPFFMIDFVLRYGVNFIYLSDYKYYVVPVLFDCFWIFGIVYFCYGVLPKTIGKILYSILHIFFGVMFLANYVYYCVFGQFMWFRALRLAGEGLDYAKDVMIYIDARVIAIGVCYLLLLVATLLLWKRPNYKRRFKRYVLAFIPFLLLVLLHVGILVDTNIQVQNGAWEVWERPVLVYKTYTDANKSLNMSGFYQFTFKSIYRDIFSKDAYSEQERMCDEYFAQRAQNRTDNSMTGILKGKNVIFVLLESVDDWLISEENTPTMYYMMENGINFTNHYMPNLGSGYTFNAEFAMNTGFYCPSNASSASVYTSHAYPHAMPNLFKADGYNTNSFHFNSRNFYNREAMHKKFGHNEYYCLMDYMAIEKCVQDSEVPKTDKVYEKMTEGKFFDFYISYSCHLPYNTMDNKLKGAMENYPELIDESLDEELRNIRLLAHDTDEFFRLMIERLKEDGLYEDTVFIAVADHYAYGLQDKEMLQQYSEEAGSAILEKVPFFIYSPSLKPKQVDKVTSAIDILPTVANLFGYDTTYALGHDAFDPNYDGFVYFAGGKWFDGEILYDPNDGMQDYSREVQTYIVERNKEIVQMSAVNDAAINGDYFK